MGRPPHFHLQGDGLMLHSVLLQAAGTVQELIDHPYMVAVAIGLLFTGLVTSTKVLLSVFESRMNEQFEESKRHNKEQDRRLDMIETDLRKYDTHVAVGAQETAAIHSAISRLESTLVEHVHREENTTWVKIDNLGEAITKMQLENELAHSALNAGQTSLARRVEAVEQKMPNGELAKLADAFAALSKRGTRGQK